MKLNSDSNRAGQSSPQQKKEQVNTVNKLPQIEKTGTVSLTQGQQPQPQTQPVIPIRVGSAPNGNSNEFRNFNTNSFNIGNLLRNATDFGIKNYNSYADFYKAPMMSFATGRDAFDYFKQYYSEISNYGYDMTPDAINKEVGFTPTYWESAQRIGRLYNAMQVLPDDMTPEWMDRDFISTMNDYYTQVYKGKPWWEWSQTVHKDDPARALLQAMPLPPPDFMLPSEKAYQEEALQIQKQQAEYSQQLAVYNEFKAKADAEGKTIDQVIDEYIESQKLVAGSVPKYVWDTLPFWQKAVIRGIPVLSSVPLTVTGGVIGSFISPGIGTAAGVAVGAGASAAMQKYLQDEQQKEAENPEYKSTALKLMSWLDWPADQVESAIGTAFQIAYSFSDPKDYGSILELLKDYKNTWRAGRYMYNTIISSPAYDDKSYGVMSTKLGSPEPEYEPIFEGNVPKTYIPQAAAFKYIREQLKTKTTPEVAKDIEQKFGFPGTAVDLVGHVLLDPINYLLPATANEVGKLIASTSSDNLLKIAFETSDGPIVALKKYKDLVGVAGNVDDLKDLSWVQKFILDVDSEGNKTWLAKPDTSNWLGGVKAMFGLTPEGRSAEAIRNFVTNLSIIVKNTEMTPEEVFDFVDALKLSDEDTIAKMSVNHPWLKSPDGAATVFMLRDYDAGGKILEMYRATRPYYDYLSDMAKALDVEPEELLSMLKNDTTEKLYHTAVDSSKDDELMNARLRTSVTNPEKPMTLDELTKIRDVFTKGATPAPFNADMFKAQFYTSLIDHANNWAVQWFGVKPDPWAIRMSNAIKSAQSWLLLGTNPTFVVNNTVDNLVKMAWTGVLDFKSQSAIDDFWTKTIGFKPEELNTGVTAIGDAASKGLTEGVSAAKVYKGSDLASTINKFFKNKFFKETAVAGNASRAVESMSSQQAWTKGTVKALAQLLQPGVGFDELPSDLLNEATRLGVNIDSLYGAVKGGTGKEFVEKLIYTGSIKADVDSALPSVVDNLNKAGFRTNVSDVKSMLSELGLDTIIDEAVKDASTPDEIHSGFNKVRSVVQDKLNKIIEDNEEEIMSRATSRVVAEGGQAMFDIFDDMLSMGHDFRLQNFDDWERVVSAADTLSGESKDALIKLQMRSMSDRNDRMQRLNEAKLRGMLNGMDVSDEVTQSILGKFHAIENLWNDFYDTKYERLDKYFSSSLTGDNRKAAWYKANSSMIDDYVKASGSEEKILVEMDALLSNAAEKQISGSGKSVADWLNIRRQALSKERTMMLDVQKKLLDADNAASRRSIWHSFMSDYKKMTLENRVESNEAGKRIFGARDEYVRPTIDFKSINDLQYSMKVHNVGSWSEWRDTFRELNKYLDDGDVPFTEYDYLVSPSQEWWGKFKKVINKYDNDPQRLSAPTMFTTDEGISWIPRSEVRKTFAKQMKQTFGLTDDQANDILMMSDARASVWANENISTVDEWYATHIGGVVSGSKDAGGVTFKQTSSTVNPFYSRLSSAIDKAPFDRAPVSKWKSVLLQSSKRSELVWTNVYDFLDTLDGSSVISKSELSGILADSAVKYDYDVYAYSSHKINQPGIKGGTEYHDYILPSYGGENYNTGESFEILGYMNKYYGDKKYYPRPHYSNSQGVRENPIYLSLRASDRTSGGKRILFVEEVQSDVISSFTKAKNRLGLKNEPFPFTDDWENIAVKTAVDFAVKNGYDAVSFASSKTPLSFWSTDAVAFERTEDGLNLYFNPAVENKATIGDTAKLIADIKDSPYTVKDTFMRGYADSNVGPSAEAYAAALRGSREISGYDDAQIMKIATELEEAFNSGAKQYVIDTRGRGMRQNYDVNIPNIAKKYASQNGLGDVYQAVMDDVGKIDIVGTESDSEMPTSFYLEPFRTDDEKFSDLHQFDAFIGANLPTIEDAAAYAKSVYSGTTFDLTDEFKSKILNNGQPLAQRAGEVTKGQVSFNTADGKAIIQAFDSADLSTAVHELAHIFRKDLPSTAIDKIMSWLKSEYGVDVRYNSQLGYFLPDGKVIDGVPTNVWAEEKFARTYEKWLRTGAPTKLEGVSDEMIKVFDDFKEWMTSIYEHVRGSDIDTKTNDDIRQVFEYMLDVKSNKPTTTSKMFGSDVVDPVKFLPGVMNNAGRDGLGNELDSPVKKYVVSKDKDEFFFHKIESGANKGKVGTYLNGKLQGWMTKDHFDSLEWMDSSSGKYRVLGVSTVDPGCYLVQLEDNSLVSIPFKAQGSISTPPIVKAPLGAIDENQPAPPLSEMMYEGTELNVVPVLDELENVMAKSPMHTVNTNIPDSFKNRLTSYFNKTSGQVEQSKLAAVKIGKTLRDYALLDYHRQYGFDKIAQMVLPYEFWYTRTALNWLMRFIDNPKILSNYYRLRSLSQYSNMPGFPTRLKGKVAIPLPFTQTSWSGDSLWVDPLRQIFSFEQFLEPFRYKKEEERRLEYTAANAVNKMLESGQINDSEANDAISKKSGKVWETAMQQAVTEVEPDMSNPYDFMSAIVSPSLPLNWAVKFATGQQSDISQLPLVRTIQAITGILGVGKRGVNIGGEFRKMLDMPAVDKWDDYRIARQLSNMIGDGSADVNDAIMQMMNQSGPLYDQAMKDVGKSQGWRQMLSTLAADFYPEGEQTQRQRYEMYSAMFSGVDNINGDAYGKMMDMMPELEGRMMSMKKPEDMIRQYLITNIWNKYNDMQPRDKQRVRDVLGNQFSEQIINKSTRDYDSVSTDSLAFFARSLGAKMPDKEATAPAANIELSTPDVSTKVKDYYSQMNELFPDIDAKLSASYSQLGDLPMFDDYLKPVNEYNMWKNAYLAKNPEIIPEVIGPDNSLYDLPNDIQATVYQYRALRDQVFPNIFDVQDKYFNSGFTGRQKHKYLIDHPELIKYWEFRRQYAAENPRASSYILGDDSLSGYISKSKDLSTKSLMTADMFNPLIANSLTGYFYNGDDLGPGATANLRSMWSNLGEPYNNFDAWLQLDVRPMMSAK